MARSQKTGHCIDSSDATACGLNPYMSMLELWMIKTGRMQQNIEDESAGYAFILGQATRTIGG
jgi:predicted phage-related endonuclease